MDVNIDLIDLEGTVVNASKTINRKNFNQKAEENRYTGVIDRTEFCEKCNMTFPTWSALFMHKISDPSTHTCCYFCGKDFKTAAGTVRHQRQDHAAEQNLTCVGCNMRFNRAGAYVSHIEHKQCPVIHKSDFDKMREEKESQHSARQPMAPNATLTPSPGAHHPGPDQWSWENWTNGRVETERPNFNEMDFPVLTAKTNGISNVSTVLTGISNKLSPKGNAKGLSPALKPVNLKEYHPCDPSNPEFDVSKYYSPFGDIWICPWPGCKKTKKTASSLVQHMKAHADANTETLRCPACLATFRSATALVQHAESQAIKCNIRESSQFRQAIDQMTGGLVDIDPLDERHFDDTIKYTAGKVVTAVNGHSTIANASAAYWAEQEERRQQQIKEMEKTARW